MITKHDADLTFRQLCWDIAAVWPAWKKKTIMN
jgi:hypothetical protein